MSTVLNYGFENAPPVRSHSRRAFATGGSLAAAVFADVGPHSAYTFTTPFAGRLLKLAGGGNLEADIDQDQGVGATQWPGRVIAVGVPVTVRFVNDDSIAPDPVSDYVDFEEEPSLAAAPDLGPVPATVPDITQDNTTPAAASLSGLTHENAAPAQLVIPGEVAPVVSGTPPTPPTLAAHNTTLLAGVNYTVQVGSRSAPVTVTLPAAPSAGQRIEVVDTSGQAAQWPITVDAGAVDLETPGTKTYLISRNDAVLALYYTGAKWKIL